MSYVTGNPQKNSWARVDIIYSFDWERLAKYAQHILAVSLGKNLVGFLSPRETWASSSSDT